MQNGVENIQTAGYNGAHTVVVSVIWGPISPPIEPVGTSNLQNWCNFWKRLMSIWHTLISILGWHGFESSLEVGFLPFWQKLGLKTYSMQIFLNAKFVKVCNRNGTRLKIVHRNHKVYKISRENIVSCRFLYPNIFF